MEYIVVEDNAPDLLADEVNKLMVLGWRPLGGVSMTITGVQDGYCQAMTRETETK